MSNIEKEFLHSMLSVVSYVDFEEGLNTNDDIKKVLGEDDEWKHDKKKIEFVASNFAIPYHQPDTDSGFSATVFQVKEGVFSPESLTPYVISTRAEASNTNRSINHTNQ